MPSEGLLGNDFFLPQNALVLVELPQRKSQFLIKHKKAIDNPVPMITTNTLFAKCKNSLELELLTAEEGLSRQIEIPEVQRPGLSLSGYLKHFVFRRFIVFGRTEIEYLQDLSAAIRKERLEAILVFGTQGVFISKQRTPPKELVNICQERSIPLIQSTQGTQVLLNRLTFFLDEEFAPSTSCHATFVEAYGVGVLIQGDSSVGKSEAALGLIERGHRLVSDDVVRIRVKEGRYLIGSGPELTRHFMEIRGIGIIDVAQLYGAVCVREAKVIDLVVKLEAGDDSFDQIDRLGIDQEEYELFGVSIPFHVLRLKPGRDVVLLLETLALNHRLKSMGYHSAKTLRDKLRKVIEQKKENHAVHACCQSEE